MVGSVTDSYRIAPVQNASSSGGHCREHGRGRQKMSQMMSEMIRQMEINRIKLEHTPKGAKAYKDFVKSMQEEADRRAADVSDGRGGISGFWAEASYMPNEDLMNEGYHPGGDLSNQAYVIGKRMAIDGETAFRILIMADDLIERWYGHQIYFQPLSKEIAYILGLQERMVYGVLKEQDRMLWDRQRYGLCGGAYRMAAAY